MIEFTYEGLWLYTVVIFAWGWTMRSLWEKYLEARSIQQRKERTSE